MEPIKVDIPKAGFRSSSLSRFAGTEFTANPLDSTYIIWRFLQDLDPHVYTNESKDIYLELPFKDFVELFQKELDIKTENDLIRKTDEDKEIIWDHLNASNPERFSDETKNTWMKLEYPMLALQLQKDAMGKSVKAKRENEGQWLGNVAFGH